MADQTSKVVLEIEVDDSGIIESARRTRREYEKVNKNQVSSLKQQKENVKDVTKMKSETESPQALRKILDSSRRRLDTEKQTLRVMREQEAVAKRLMRSGGVGAGPLDLFGRQTGAGLGGGLSGLLGMRSGKAGRGIGRGVGGMLGGMGRGGMMALGRMGGPLGMLASALGSVGTFAYGATSAKIRAGHQMNMSQQELLGALSGGGTSPAEMKRAQLMGNRLGFGPLDTLSQARDVALQTGEARAVTTAQQYARTTMMGVGDVAGVMGATARAGTGFTGTSGGAGEKAMERIYGNAFRTGIDKSRFAEVFRGAATLFETAGGVIGGAVNTGGIADLIGQLGSTKEAGLQGTRGIAVLQKLDQAIKTPGGGEHGQALMLQAFGFGKPGGNTSYYDAIKRQQMGIADPRNVRDMWAEAGRQTYGEKERNMYLWKMTGLSLDQIEKVGEALKTAGGTQAEQDQAIKDAVQEALPIEEQSLTKLGEMSTLLAEMKDHEYNTLLAGEATSDVLLNIQGLTNQLVTGLIPLARLALEALRDIYAEAIRFSTLGEKEEKRKLNAAAREDINLLRQQIIGGSLTEEQIKDARQRISDRYGSIDALEYNKLQPIDPEIRKMMKMGEGGTKLEDLEKSLGIDLPADVEEAYKTFQKEVNAPGAGVADRAKARENFVSNQAVVEAINQQNDILNGIWGNTARQAQATEEVAEKGPVGQSSPPPRNWVYSQ